jgi:hypothetical protein
MCIEGFEQASRRDITQPYMATIRDATGPNETIPGDTTGQYPIQHNFTWRPNEMILDKIRRDLATGLNST